MEAQRLQGRRVAGTVACEQRNVRLPIRAFLFEAPGVFYDDTLWRRWLLHLLARAGFRLPYDEFFAVWDRKYAPGIYCGEEDLIESLESFLKLVGLPTALIDEVMAARRARCREVEADQRALPGVSQVLGRLRADGFRLAVTADCEWSARQMREKLQRLGLADHVDLVTTSVELGCLKPAVVSFSEPAYQLHLEPGHVAFVGVRPVHIEGAKRAGMTTITLNGIESCRADWSIRCLSKLPSLPQLSESTCA